MPVPEISHDALAPRIGQVVLIDVRQPDEYAAGHVRTARLLPLHELPDHVGELPVGEDVVVMCRTGARSEVASEFLIENGVSAFNLVGGIQAWAKAGYEVVAADQPA
ncbi:MAG TPA: rhodanese-like domain-containing protein [Acidimicrobiales bacterium]|jgi:rhodanese-related sulfurtransferase